MEAVEKSADLEVSEVANAAEGDDGVVADYHRAHGVH